MGASFNAVCTGCNGERLMCLLRLTTRYYTFDGRIQSLWSSWPLILKSICVAFKQPVTNGSLSYPEVPEHDHPLLVCRSCIKNIRTFDQRTEK